MKKKIELETGVFLHLTDKTNDVAGVLQAVREKVQRILLGIPDAIPAQTGGAERSPRTAEKPLGAVTRKGNLAAPSGAALAEISGAALAEISGAALADISGAAPIPVPGLARGAVLPANRPFLAVVGDQRDGVNVEAPLTTIQEAVALVMEDQTQALTAGLEANLSVARDILDAVLGIRIGDEIIAQASERYYRTKAVAEGGIL